MADNNRLWNKLIIVCGLSFAGKTTLGNAICAEYGYPQIDVDVTKEALYPGVVDQDLNRKQWDEIYRKTDEQMVDYLRNGCSVVDASRNFRKDERNSARGIAWRVGVDVVTVYVDAPVSLVRKRWAENKVNRERREVSTEDFEEIIKIMEPPIADENPIVFQHDEDIRTWLANHEKWLTADPP